MHWSGQCRSDARFAHGGCENSGASQGTASLAVKQRVCMHLTAAVHELCELHHSQGQGSSLAAMATSDAPSGNTDASGTDLWLCM
jgi:hypothetical protein